MKANEVIKACTLWLHVDTETFQKHTGRDAQACMFTVQSCCSPKCLLARF